MHKDLSYALWYLLAQLILCGVMGVILVPLPFEKILLAAAVLGTISFCAARYGVHLERVSK